MPRQHNHLHDEHPLNHTFQILAVILFFTLWIPDSFLFQFTTFLSFFIPWFISAPAGIIVLVIGLYFLKSSHDTVFGSEQTGVIDTGVYGRVRHPMYFGSLLIFLGLIIITLSLITLLLWIFVFVGFDRMASYEERVLIERFGDNYREYQGRVSKWFPV